MAEGPDVTVVIPTRNRWPLLSATALPAALGQEDVDLEVVVVDDGSTDETSTRLSELAGRDDRVRVVRRDSSGGVAAARNAGIERARGEWIAFLDDDDVWSPRKLRAQLDHVTAEEGAGFVYAGVVAVDARGAVLYRYHFPDPSRLRDELLVASVIPGGASNVVARASLVRRLGGFDEEFRHLEDWDLWIRMASAAPASALSDVLVAVVSHSANKHATHDQTEELERLIAKHASLDPPRALAVDRAGYSRWVASQHSRAGMHRRAAALYLRAAVRHRQPTNVLRALDAAAGKRVGAFAARRRDGVAEPVAAPRWLERYSLS